MDVGSLTPGVLPKVLSKSVILYTFVLYINMSYEFNLKEKNY
jgi:hypothetical protein